ncbi:MAG: threonine synthase [Firmicutes bacterium]|nr:threonine synthase [Bacillota bacterium]
MGFVKHLECVSCGSTYPAGEHRYACAKCNGYLQVVFDIDRMKESLNRRDFQCRPQGIMERWLEFLPIEKPELVPRVSLGESVTPLIHARHLGQYLGLDNLFFKDETRFPTGSLKDRSMPLVVLKALEFGFSSVSIVSSGNAAASLSAYAARAGLQAVVFVAGGRSARLAKCRSYGSMLIHVDAPYSEVEALYLEARQAYGWYDCNGLINPFRLEGKKTLAHEVCQSLDWSVPDVVVMPTCFGNGLVSAWRGFLELEALGWCSGKPAVFGAQPEACGPIARAFERGDRDVRPVAPALTVATSIAVGDPSIGGKRVLEVAEQSHGGVAGVSEELILQAQALLARKEGLFVEPAGAVGVAAIIRLVSESRLSREDIVVASITGEGLNDPDAIEPWAPSPHIVTPDMESLNALLKRIAS